MVFGNKHKPETRVSFDSGLVPLTQLLQYIDVSQFQVSNNCYISTVILLVFRTCFNSSLVLITIYCHIFFTMKVKVQQKRLNKKATLVENERRFKKACEQIVQLNYSLDALQQRYNRAKKDNHRSFRYSLRLRIAVVDGMRNMYYDYAHKKAEAVAELRQELFGEVVDIVSDESTMDTEMY